MATPNVVPRADSEGGLGTASKYWASAYIDNIFVGAGFVGRDADNNLDFSTDNNIFFKINGSNEIVMDANRIYPATSDGSVLGHPNYHWSDLFLASGAVINFDNGDFTLSHGSAGIGIADGKQFRIGSGNDLRLYHTGGVSYVSNEGNGNLEIRNLVDDADVILSCDDGSGGTTAYITLDGSVAKTKVDRPLLFADNISSEYGAGTDMIMYHSGNNGFIENYNGNFTIIQHTNDADIIFKCDDGSGNVTAYITLEGTNVRTKVHKNLNLEDNVQLQIGNSQDLKIYHNTSHSFIEQQGVGNLHIRNIVDDGDVVFQSDDGSGGTATYFYLDGSSATHDGSATTALYTNWLDKSRISLGTSHDMLMYHDGTQTVYQNRVGNFFITNSADDSDIIFQSDDGSGGVTEYFKLDGSDAKNRFSKPIEVGSDGAGHDTKFFLAASGRHIMIDADDNSLVFTDNANAKFGNGGDLQISHNGTDSRIDNMVGHLKIRNYSDDSDIYFESDNGSGGVETYFFLDGGIGHNRFSKHILVDNNVNLDFGGNGNTRIKTDGSNSFIQNFIGDLTIENNTDDGDIIFKSDDGSGGTATYFFLDGSQTRTQFDKDIMLIGGTNYIFVDNSASTMTFADGALARFGTNGDLRISHDSSHSYISQEGTGSLFIRNTTDDQDIIFQSDDGSGGVVTYFQLDGSKGYTVVSKRFNFSDNIKTTFGNSEDLQIYHDSTDSFISNDTGHLYIKNAADDKDIEFQCDNGSGGTTPYFRLDGSLATHDGSATTNLHTVFPDLSNITLGDGQDFSMKHDGTDTIFNNQTGNYVLRNSADDKDMLFQCDNGSGGTTTYFELDGSENMIMIFKSTRISDNHTLQIGSGADLRISHNGTNSLIDNYTGHLIISNNSDNSDIIFQNDDGSGGLATYFKLDGSHSGNPITLFPDNSQLHFGDGFDFRITHDGSQSILNNQTGNLEIVNNSDDGDIFLKSDAGDGTTTPYIQLDGSEVSTKILTQKVMIPNLPTSDPSNAGQLWNDSGTLKISAG